MIVNSVLYAYATHCDILPNLIGWWRSWNMVKSSRTDEWVDLDFVKKCIYTLCQYIFKWTVWGKVRNAGKMRGNSVKSTVCVLYFISIIIIPRPWNSLNMIKMSAIRYMTWQSDVSTDGKHSLPAIYKAVDRGDSFNGDCYLTSDLSPLTNPVARHNDPLPYCRCWHRGPLVTVSHRQWLACIRGQWRIVWIVRSCDLKL